MSEREAAAAREVFLWVAIGLVTAVMVFLGAWLGAWLYDRIQARRHAAYLMQRLAMVPPEGSRERGRDLVLSLHGCTACHSTDKAESGPGPSLLGVGARAGTRVPGLSARDYLVLSIVDPDRYVVSGRWVPMRNYDDMSGPDVADIVAYLLTL